MTDTIPPITVTYLDPTGIAQVVTITDGRALTFYQTGITYYPDFPSTDICYFLPYYRVLLIQTGSPAPNWK